MDTVEATVDPITGKVRPEWRAAKTRTLEENLGVAAAALRRTANTIASTR